MGTNSTGNGTGNGHGSGPFDEAVLYDDDGPVHDAIGRLVDVLLREALAKRCNEIQIDCHEDGCPVHLVRGSEKLELDRLPKRLFGSLKDEIARKCGKRDADGHGTFSASLKKTETSAMAHDDVHVSVVFGESHLRLTITDVKRISP